MPCHHSAQSRRLRRGLLTGALLGLTTLQPATQAASSLPTGGAFTAGSGNISAAGNILTINQASFRGIIDWKTFSISQGALVNFKNGSGATLNRVNGGAATSLLGQLLATGSVYIINPEGVLIGHGATVHTGGDFVASTVNLSSNAFFNGGTLTFSGSSAATVVNLGSLTSTGGSVYLIGHSVRNGGSISTPNGTTGLAAGGQVLITDSAPDSVNDQHVFVQTPGGDVTNSGFIHAAQVELKSNGGNIYALAGNNGGQIQATGTATKDGRVWLIATNGTSNVSGLISATNVTGTGGAIETSGAHVITSGAQLKTGKGGNWLLDPDDLTIDSTLAGTIETSLNGGTNVSEQTSASGTGGSGDITVASNIAWSSGANLTLSAYRNIGINNGVTISNAGTGNLTLRADNTANGTGAVTINGLVDFSGSTGNVAILYDPTGIETAKYGNAVTYNTGASGTQVKTNSTWTAPTDASVSSQSTAYTLVNNVTDLQNVSSYLSGTYALGADIEASSVTNFAPIGPNYSNQFSGIFDGQGHTINNLSINDTTDSYVGLFGISRGIIRNLNLTGESVSGSNYEIGGLAGENNGTVANVVSAGTIAATNQAPSIGGLLGENYYSAKVTNSSSSATLNLTGANFQGDVGGLVGYNLGSISTSYATGPVTVSTSGQFANPAAGGLVGYNDANSSIANSYATGAVNISGATNSNYTPSAGGLVGGSYYTTIQNSYATGPVTGGVNVYTGGLVGYKDYGSSISSSYASGAVSAATTNRGGGLFGYYNSGSATITSSYWDTQVTNQSGAAGNSASITGASGQITSYLQSGTLPSGFSSSNWASVSGLYPLLTWQGKLISGSVFNGSSQLASVTVDALANGSNIGSATTNGSGFYSIFVPNAYVFGASGVLAYLPGATKGNTFSDGDGSGNYTGMNIYAGTLLLSNRTNSTYSAMLIALNAALGSNSGASFLFAPNSGNINLNSGTNLSINSQIGFNLDKTISAPSGTVTITSQGDVSQSEPITSGEVSLSGAGNFSLGQANSIGTLAANTGANLAVINSGDITIGTAGGVTGVTAGGSVSISSNSGNLTIAAGSTVTASGSGDALQLSAGNDFINLAGSNALSVSGGGGRWLVFSQNPANDTRGGLAYDFKQYNYNAGVDSPDQSTGNGFIYTYAPSLTVGLTGTVSKTYDGTTAATLTSSNYSLTGGIDGDSVALTGTPASGNFADQNYGLSKTVNVSGLALSNVTISNGSATIYGYQLASTIASGDIGTINPATLTYSANSANRTYGASNPAFSGTITGFVNNETLSSATTGAATFTSPVTSSSNVGTYVIDGAGLSANHGNYTFTQASGNSSALIINPATLIYTANSANRTYGASDPAFSGTVTGFVNNETLSAATTGAATFTSPVTSSSNVGTYAIDGTGLTANRGNYIFTQASGNSSAFTINPATLAYAANPISEAYGAISAAFTGTVTGFVNGETQTSANTGSLAFSSPATASSPAGSYAIIGSGLTANHGNYEFVQAAGNATALTVTAAVVLPPPPPITAPPPTPTPAPPAPTVLTFLLNNATSLYGQPEPTFTATYTGPSIPGLNISSILSGLTFQTTPSRISGPGTYLISASGSAPPGYVLDIPPATFTVIDSSPQTVPSQAVVSNPVLPVLLPATSGPLNTFLGPTNSLGLFQIGVATTNNGFGASFASFGTQQAPLAQSSFFTNSMDQSKTYFAGAKP